MKNLVLLLAVVFISACATTGEKLTIKKLSINERVYSGRIFIDFNGQKNADAKCEIYVGRGLVPDIKTSDEGYIFFKSDSKGFRLSRITCYEQPDFYTAAWHNQSLPLEKFVRSDSPYKATYFGDIYITWKTNPEDTKRAAAQDVTSPQFPKIGRVENSGILQIEVRDAFADNEKIFAERVKNEAWNAKDSKIVLENHPAKISQE